MVLFGALEHDQLVEADGYQLAEAQIVLLLRRVAAEGARIVERVDVFTDDLHRRTFDLEQSRVLGLAVCGGVRLQADCIMK